MHPKDIAARFTHETGGGGGAAAYGLDRQLGRGPSNSHFRFVVTGNAPAGPVTLDQANFFEAQPFGVISAAHALATVTPAAPDFTNAQVGTFAAYQPVLIRNVNITGADSAPTVSSMQVQPTRITPMQEDQTDTLYASAFQNSSDFQTTRVQIPLQTVVDGYSTLRLVNDANATPASYTAQFLAGPRPDRRYDVPQVAPAVIKSPGQM